MSVSWPIERDNRRRDIPLAIGQTVVDVDFPVFDGADLWVGKRLTDTETDFTELTSGFTAAPAEDLKSATITFAISPRPDSTAVTLRVEGRRVHQRTTDVRRDGAVQGAALERELDFWVMIAQELRRDISEVGPGIYDAAARAEAAAVIAAAAILGIVPDNSIATAKLQNSAVTLAKIASAVYGTSGANKLLQLDAAGKLPALDGGQLTGLLIGQISGSRWPLGYLSGLTLAYVSATSFQVGVGVCRNEDSGAAADMALATALTKTTAAWAAGGGNGALDQGAVANSTWYHVHLIQRTIDGLIDVLLSTSATAPLMPTGWTARRRLGSARTNGSAQLTRWTQLGDEFLWDAAVVDFDAVNPGTSAVLRALSVPTGVQVMAIAEFGIVAGTTNNNVAWISSPDTSDQAPLATGITTPLGAPISSASAPSGPAWMMSERRVRTNTSAQIRTRLANSGAADRIGGITRGWVDLRGKG